MQQYFSSCASKLGCTPQQKKENQMLKLFKFPFQKNNLPENTGKIQTLQTRARGFEVLHNPFLNKGIAFTPQERVALALEGLIPTGFTTLEQQVTRAYEQYRAQTSDLAKNIYLTALHDRNEVLFYKLFTLHVKEMMPIVYDPTVGLAIQNYSHAYRRPRGIYLSIDEPQNIENNLRHAGLYAQEVDLLVCTDAEEILGIGDWGVGGIDIAIGKLAVYTAIAGVHPNRVIPVMLDVGTNNDRLLNDPLYMGNRHARVRGALYDAFIEKFVQAVQKLFPQALLHWEDFGPDNGRRILLKYREKLATFNDDMQGTGAITLAAVLNALKVAKSDLTAARIVIFGAGTAGVGIADQLRDAMVRAGLSKEAATQQFWLIDKQGLLTHEMMDTLRDYQKPYARKDNTHNGKMTLAEVVAQIHPTILIGTSTTPHTFTEAIVKTMAAHTERPIILPLSNPTALAEATPQDLIKWTNGQALIATGSPFPPVEFNGTTFTIGQANNALLYPGLGLGTIVTKATEISDEMFWAAALAVANSAQLNTKGASLLPSIEELRSVSANVAIAVGKAAIAGGKSHTPAARLEEEVKNTMWEPHYPHIEAI